MNEAFNRCNTESMKVYFYPDLAMAKYKEHLQCLKVVFAKISLHSGSPIK